MADDEKPWTLSVATELLNVNFDCRSVCDDANSRQRFRRYPSEASIEIWSENESIFVELPIAVPGLIPLEITDSKRRTPRHYRYCVENQDVLLSCIHALNGMALLPELISTEAQPGIAGSLMKIEKPVRTTLARNTILYGPPGTGKTFSTLARAVKTCDGKLPATGGDDAIRLRYIELQRDGRITFVTFHQSYGNEEFVEGLRPVANSTGQVSYSVMPGTFRKACDAARMRQLVKPGLTGKPLNERRIFKMSLGASWNDEGVRVFQYALKNACVLLGYGDDVDFSDCDDENAIRQRFASEAPDTAKSDRHVWTVNYFKHELKVGDIIIVSNGNKSFRAIAEVVGEYEYVDDAPFHQMRAVKWLAVFEAGRPTSEILTKDFSMATLYKINVDAIKCQEIEALLVHEIQVPEVAPHLLIIDEINRANISKVFGELITLLEPDKREGALNALTVKLPYSGDDFRVPGNLHVLGTMNTADRSIALLDTALRRRFDFEELLPDPSTLAGEHIDGVDLEALLTVLNERIEVLFDRDHTIGHAFFLGIATLADLELVFRRKVLPLLQEYFYENLSNVRRVLNDTGEGAFVRRQQRAPLPSDGDDAYADEPRLVFSINPAPFPIDAYQRIYAGR